MIAPIRNRLSLRFPYESIPGPVKSIPWWNLQELIVIFWELIPLMIQIKGLFISHILITPYTPKQRVGEEEEKLLLKFPFNLVHFSFHFIIDFTIFSSPSLVSSSSSSRLLAEAIFVARMNSSAWFMELWLYSEAFEHHLCHFGKLWVHSLSI